MLLHFRVKWANNRKTKKDYSDYTQPLKGCFHLSPLYYPQKPWFSKLIMNGWWDHLSHETIFSALMGYITTSPILGAQEPPYGHRILGTVFQDPILSTSWAPGQATIPKPWEKCRCLTTGKIPISITGAVAPRLNKREREWGRWSRVFMTSRVQLDDVGMCLEYVLSCVV